MFPRFFLAATLAFALTACDSGGDAADLVSVSGTVTNAFGLPVSGATVDYAAGAGKRAASTVTDADGTYALQVEAGAQTVTVTKGGYTPYTTTTAATAGATLTPTIEGPASVSGTLVDALTGDAVGGATVEFVVQADAGEDPAAGPVEVRTRSGADGAFAFDRAPSGTYVCVVTPADGGTPFVVRDVEFQATGETELGQSVLTPLPAAGEYRVVLTWGEAPSDLDSHLTGPRADGDGRFHVYFSARAYLGTNLDVDDVSSFGPETVTIVPPADGLYRYSVHNYSDQSADGATGIAASPARVQVFDAGGLIRTYDAPTASAGDGNAWRVFEMTVQDGSVSFSGATPGGLGYVQASSSGDAGAFVRGLPAKSAAG